MQEVSVKESDVKLIIDKLCKTIANKKTNNDDNVSNQEIYLLTIIMKFIQSQPEELILQIIIKNQNILSDVVHLLGSQLSSTEVAQFMEMATLMLHKLLKN